MLFKPKFVYHKKLESHIWDSNNHMRPDVRSALLILVNQILNEVRQLNLPFDQSNVRDIFVHGSITNYYYRKNSDIDICVVCDLSGLMDKFPGVNIPKLLKNITLSIFDRCNPTVCGRELDIEFVDTRWPLSQSGMHKGGGGIYSVLRDKWLRASVQLSNHEFGELYRGALVIYRDMAVRLYELMHKNAEALDTYVNHICSKYNFECDKNYIQPLTPYTVAFRMARATRLINRARERAMKLRAKQQSGKK